MQAVYCLTLSEMLITGFLATDLIEQHQNPTQLHGHPAKPLLKAFSEHIKTKDRSFQTLIRLCRFKRSFGVMFKLYVSPTQN